MKRPIATETKACIITGELYEFISSWFDKNNANARVYDQERTFLRTIPLRDIVEIVPAKSFEAGNIAVSGNTSDLDISGKEVFYIPTWGAKYDRLSNAADTIRRLVGLYNNEYSDHTAFSRVYSADDIKPWMVDIRYKCDGWHKLYFSQHSRNGVTQLIGPYTSETAAMDESQLNAVSVSSTRALWFVGHEVNVTGAKAVDIPECARKLRMTNAIVGGYNVSVIFFADDWYSGPGYGFREDGERCGIISKLDGNTRNYKFGQLTIDNIPLFYPFTRCMTFEEADLAVAHLRLHSRRLIPESRFH